MTPKQAQLLDFIKSFMIKGKGVAPSFDEMAAAVGVKSKSGVHRLVSALEDQGHIHRLPYRARAIALGPKPYTHITIHSCPNCGHRMAA